MASRDPVGGEHIPRSPTPLARVAKGSHGYETEPLRTFRAGRKGVMWTQEAFGGLQCMEDVAQTNLAYLGVSREGLLPKKAHLEVS